MTLAGWIEDERRRFEVPGLAVVVVHDGKVVLSEAFGHRDLARDLPVTSETAFAIGSVTKAFTAATVAALVDDGVLEWDRPVREYIAGFRMHDPVATECLSPRDLLCHRSGLPRHDLVWYGEETLTRREFVERLRFLEPNKSFRSTWQYNNLMYLTAGYLCEAVTGRTWEDLLHERVLEPLAMRATTFNWDQCGEVSLPYGERDSKLQLIPYERAPDACGPAGSIYSTIEDMTAWLQVNLGAGRLGDEQVLAETTIRELHTPQMVMPDSRILPEAYNVAYGLGWTIGDYRGHKTVHHGGNIDGFSALVAMVPEANAGVVVLSNRNITMIREAITYHVFDDVLGLEAIEWGERWKETEDALWGGMKEANAKAPRVEGARLSHGLDDYAGDYEHPAYGRFGVTLVAGKLQPSFHGLGLTLTHRHYDVFDLVIEEFETSQLAAIFRTDADGDIADVTIGFEPSVEPIVFTRLPDVLDPAVAARLPGTYSNGPLAVDVALDPSGRLTVKFPGGPRRALLPHRGLKFRVEGAAGALVTFVTDDSGAPTEVVVRPGGVFRRV